MTISYDRAMDYLVTIEGHAEALGHFGDYYIPFGDDARELREFLVAIREFIRSNTNCCEYRNECDHYFDDVDGLCTDDDPVCKKCRDGVEARTFARIAGDKEWYRLGR